MSLLINGAGWQPNFPRLLSTSDLETAIRKARSVGKGRFRTIADISCDVGGGIEFLHKMSTIDEPFFYTDGRTTSRFSGNGRVQVMSVDILPSELPLSASTHFSKALKPYLRSLVNSYRGHLTDEDRHALDVIDGATIARGGQLAAPHQWLSGLLASNAIPQTSRTDTAGTVVENGRKSSDISKSETLDIPSVSVSSVTSSDNAGILRKRRILLLGSGMVAKPAVDEFLKRSDLGLVVGRWKSPCGQSRT